MKDNVLTNNGAVSDEKGQFRLINVAYGEYDLMISFIGFKTYTLKDIKILALFLWNLPINSDNIAV
jgi:hypothetical protein